MSLTGDVEIDDFLPTHPRLLDEAALMPCGPERVMILGGLNAPLLPAFDEGLDVMRFLGSLDGSRDMSTLLAQDDTEAAPRRRLLTLLARHGLLEQVAPPANAPVAPDAGAGNALEAFLARVMDQTRVFCDRTASRKSAVAPFLLCGDPGTPVEAFAHLARSAGLQPVVGRPDELVRVAASAGLAADAMLVWFQGGAACGAGLAQQLARHRTVLLMSLRGPEVHVGPLCLGEGCATPRCYLEATAGQSFGIDDDHVDAQLGFALQLLTLLLSRSAPLRLLDVARRWGWRDGHLVADDLPVPRRFGTDGTALFDAAALSSASRERLQRLATCSTPPRRFIGSKMHEVHYDPRNIAAAEEMPRAARGTAVVAGSRAEQGLLRQAARLADRVFGYDFSGAFAKRLTPSGGNLGTPEAIAILRSPEDGRETLLRYVPALKGFEQVASRVLERGGDSESRLWVACLMNCGKAQSKYKQFGLNLVHLDAGVARSFAELAMPLLGLAPAFEAGDASFPMLEEFLAQRSHWYQKGWMTEIRRAPGLLRLASQRQLRQFDKQLLARTALRAYAGIGLEPRQLAALLAASTPPPTNAIERDVVGALRIVVLMRTGAHAGDFVFSSADGWKPLAPRDGCPPAHTVGDLSVQRNLSGAPAALFVLAPLPALMQRHGPAAHDAALSCAGRWVGRFWMALGESGHGGCPAGIMVECDLARVLAPDEARNSCVLSFAFGSEPAGKPR